MKNIKKGIVALLSIIILGGSILGCGNKGESKDSKTIVFGVAPGPYGDLVKAAIAPELEKKGYEVEVKEFSDYIQPNNSLSKKEIDVNVFQHQVYLENFCKENNLELESIINIPTASMGIFSDKYESLDELKEGDIVSIPNDLPNLARAFRFLKDEGIITFKEGIDENNATEKDIDQNSKKLKFVQVEAAQLPRTISSSGITVINGNYAISSGLSLSDAVAKESLKEEYKNVIAIRISDKDSQFVKDILEIVEGDKFKEAILDEDEIYKDFDFPKWFEEKVGE